MRWAIPEKVAVLENFDFPSSTTKRLEREGGGHFWTVGLHVGRWIERNCVLTAAQYAGLPFKLLPWQWRALAEMFEVVQVDGQWRLKHRWVLIGLPKKNGKSELIGALALFFLLGTDEVDPRIFVAASTEEQANMVYQPVKFIAENSPTLAPLVTAKQRVVVSKTSRGGFVKRLAAVAGANDGANVYVALIDEFHEWTGEKGKNVWDVITNGTVMRNEPMIIQITTAGFDQETKCYEWYTSGKAMLEGDVDDPQFYFLWFEPDEEADYKDPATWSLANPSYGLIMQEEFYEDQLKRKTQAVFRRYFCNQWTEAEEIWEPAAQWDECAAKDPSETELSPYLRTYVGVDIGRKNDHCAVAIVQVSLNRARVNQKIWFNPYAVSDPRFREWRMNLYDVDNYLREVYAAFPEPSAKDEWDDFTVHGPVFVYDPHLYGSHADSLVDDGLNMVEFPQSDNKMIPASQRLHEWIMNGWITHDGDKMARRHIRSVTAKEKERGWRISKVVGSNKHVDFAIALAMALSAALDVEVKDEEEFVGLH
jgi:phage terminase large subunit-like protein